MFNCSSLAFAELFVIDVVFDELKGLDARCAAFSAAAAFGGSRVPFNRPLVNRLFEMSEFAKLPCALPMLFAELFTELFAFKPQLFVLFSRNEDAQYPLLGNDGCGEFGISGELISCPFVCIYLPSCERGAKLFTI